MLDRLFEEHRLPLDQWIQTGTDWLSVKVGPFFQATRWPVDELLTRLESALLQAPPEIVLAAVAAIVWRTAGWRTAIFATGAFTFIGFVGQWDEAMVTVAMILTAMIISVVVGFPLGLAAGINDRVEAVLRPVLDIMQTTPTFVYLVPIVIFYGIGDSPGVLATLIFAVPPLIRLTSLGIRHVQFDVVEAAGSFGSSRWQLLREIQIPLAMPSIMTGINQTLMLSLSMVVVASLIGAGGLGQLVLGGMNRLDFGLAAVAGISVVLLAIVIDRASQGQMGRRERLREAGLR